MPKTLVSADGGALSAISPPSSRAVRRVPSRVAPEVKPIVPFRDATFPELYAMKLSGDCLAPDLMDGDEVKFSSVEPPVVGDFCIFIMQPELVPRGGMQCIIKRMVMAPPPYVKLPFRENPQSEVHALVMAEQLNPRRQFMIKCEHLLAIHKFVGVQRRA
ncbi:MAG: hypothetical protein HQ481_06655 [Alphaproteobacteria bacterium]|nr:hypothetical protein [Alphaproteobacteria bacterium]